MNRMQVLKELIKEKSKCGEINVTTIEVTKELLHNLGCKTYREAANLVKVVYEHDNQFATEYEFLYERLLKRIRSKALDQNVQIAKEFLDPNKNYVFDADLYRDFANDKGFKLIEVERKIRAIGDKITVEIKHDGEFGMCGDEVIMPAYCREEMECQSA